MAFLAMPATALAWGPPRVDLRSHGERQRGGLIFQEWTTRTGPDQCVTASADGPGTFPKALEVGTGDSRARFVFHNHHKPRRVKITAWRAIGAQGNPVGPSKTLDFRLHPRRRADNTIVAWVATFHVMPPPDYYLHMYARWPGGFCGGPRHMLRTFHIGAGH